MNVRVRLSALALLIALVPASGQADPIQITDERETLEQGRGACAIWVVPVGDEYEWTDVCVSERVADGALVREAVVAKAMCDGDGSNGGAFCWSEPALFKDAVAADEMFVADDLSSAWLASDVDGCAIDLTWAATGEAERRTGEGLPRLVLRGDPVDFVLRDEPITVGYSRSASPSEMRAAAIEGTVCPEAGVDGEPRYAVVGAWERSTERKHITIRL